MAYALVQNGAIVAVRNPGRSEAKLLDGQLLSAPDGVWTDALAAACGFLPIVEPTPPTLTAQQTLDPDTFVMQAGKPTRVYNVRAKTAAELAADAQAAADQADRDQAKAAVTQLNAFIANGTANTAAQVRDMTVIQARILVRLIKDSFR